MVTARHFERSNIMLKTKTKEARPDPAKAPALIAYQVIETSGDRKPVWRRIGAAWTHKDESGYRVRLDAVPLSGTIDLRLPLENDPEEQ